MKRESGFTLIELVMVIVILGILSAFALPRFADLGQEARVAQINGIAGAIRSATSIARADALVNNQTGATGQITLEGTAIDLINGFPVVDNGDNGQVNGISVAAQITEADFNVTRTDTLLTIQARGAATPASCQITYAESTAANTAPVITVTATAANC